MANWMQIADAPGAQCAVALAGDDGISRLPEKRTLSLGPTIRMREPDGGGPRVALGVVLPPSLCIRTVLLQRGRSVAAGTVTGYIDLNVNSG